LAPMLVLLSATSPCAQVVINEVFYDPVGSDTGGEFVELLNCGRVGVALGGWTVETGNGANPDDWTVEWIGDDFDHLGPGEFFLIGESDVLPAPDFVTPLDLQNGPDGVRVTDGEMEIDVVGWGEPLFSEYYEGTPAGDVPSGSSLARSPDCYDHDDNFSDMEAAPIPTPGARNAPEIDLAIEIVHAGPVVLDESSPVALRLTVENTGSLTVDAGTTRVDVFIDGGDEPSLFASVTDSLAPRDTLGIDAAVWAACGYHEVVAVVATPGDSDAGNDRAETSFTVGAPGGLLKLNEVMFSPEDGSAEWLELVNATAGSVDPSGWLLGDEHEWSSILWGDLGPVPPGGYVVAAKDSSASCFDGCAVAETERWEALSADDTVVLLDRHGTPIETVAYDDSWGGERGVSLERVRHDVSPDEPSNWGSSVDPSGSTPCRRNSIFLPVSTDGGNLTASPNPFTPDGDGSDDRTVISYELPVARATVRLSVFDVRGRERITLLDHAPSASRSDLIWEGTDSKGVVLPSGMYIVRLEAISPREGILVDEKLAVGLVR